MNTRAFFRGLLLITAAILLAVGIADGQASDVWRKAVRICMECMGLG